MTDVTATADRNAPQCPGIHLRPDGAEVAVLSEHASAIWLCTFDSLTGIETARWRLGGRDGQMFHGFVPGLTEGTRYGLRADGPFVPEQGHRFDPAKLLIDPFAARIDRAVRYVPELSAPRSAGLDTAPFMPRCIVEAPAQLQIPAEKSAAPGLIYEVNIRALTRQHPDVPAHMRGTLAAASHPALIDHMLRLGVTHVELMPVTAWMDEPHLAKIGLANAWGYNPASFLAPDPRLAPGGLKDLGAMTAALHAAGLKVLLDVVFNHTAEGDLAGPVLSLRGLDNALYYRHREDDPGLPVNDTGCGNTLACDREPVMQLILHSLRRIAAETRIDGFRFDLATVLGRNAHGFSPDAPLLRRIAADDLLGRLELIAEPWDPGPGGYHLGQFPAAFREWNDLYRDHVRAFWRSDPLAGHQSATGALATRLCGSADIFRHDNRAPSAGINFIAAHDGMTLQDLVSYSRKHNIPNGEGNRDGTNHNLSWNCGVEGETQDEVIIARREGDVRAMFATLFLSRGIPMLTAGDEFGRTQRGNNNAYAQDNPATWLDWKNADTGLVSWVAGLAQLRRSIPELCRDSFLSGQDLHNSGYRDAVWLTPAGQEMSPGDWDDNSPFALLLHAGQQETGPHNRICLAFNRTHEEIRYRLPEPAAAHAWRVILDSARAYIALRSSSGESTTSVPRDCALEKTLTVPARCCCAVLEVRAQSAS